MENVRGLGRHLAGRLAATGESVVDVPPKLSVRVLSSFAGNARKNDGVDALATALAASSNERLAAMDPEAVTEVVRYGFEGCGLRLIRANHFGSNQTSGRILRKVGMVCQVTPPDYYEKWGRRRTGWSIACPFVTGARVRTVDPSEGF